jgi:adenylate cyclase
VIPGPKAFATVRSFLLVAAASAIAGIAYVALTGFFVLPDLALGAIAGLLIMLPIYLFDVWATNSDYGKRLRRRPFAVVVLFRTLLYVLFIVIGLLLAALATGVPASQATTILSATTISFAFVIAFGFNIIWQLSRMLGPSVLASFVTGRYHRPRLEDRVFLFMDLVGSTNAAEHLGPVRFHELLNRITFDIAESVVDYHGEIHRYVGDEIIVTWLASDGLRDAACVRAAFAMLQAVDRRGDRYQQDFGLRPRLHVALHVGPVVVGEMGDLHREIVFLGDTVNTTARIEAASRETGHDVLASRSLVDRLGSMPTELSAESIGELSLRGKEAPMPLVALATKS